jgi:lysophosphatidate acyltransferase
VAAHQERKLWAPANMPSLSLFGVIKVYIFNIIWITLCSIGCLLVWIKHLLLLGNSDCVYECNCYVERYAAFWCTSMLGRVTILGIEHLPPDHDQDHHPLLPAPVYIANHASQIDLGVVYFIQRQFKWIAKQSVLYIPGVGATMYTGDHVLINRVKGHNKNSVSNLFEKSNHAVQKGIPMFLFPQGTRVMSKRLPFKDGAFIIAQTNQSTIIPISIDIPMNVWETWYPLSQRVVPEIKLTIHPPIQTTGDEDREALKKQCFDVIYSCLPPIWENQDAPLEDKKDK